MSIVLNEYNVWCTVENKWYTTWNTTEPLVCPNNSSHAIDRTLTTILQIINSDATDKFGKKIIHSTPRPFNTTTYITGSGDDITNVDNVGDGVIFLADHKIGQPTLTSFYSDLNIINNETWLREGYVSWINAVGDTISLEIIPIVTPTVVSTNTNFNLYGGYLIVPATGNGTINVTSDLTLPTGGLVYMPDDENGITPMAFWNATWNESTKKFDTVTPAPLGNGRYNLFAAEVILNRFVNKIVLTGTASQKFSSKDATQLGHGMRFKCVTNTTLPDHNWTTSFNLTFFRRKTV